MVVVDAIVDTKLLSFQLLAVQCHSAELYKMTLKLLGLVPQASASQMVQRDCLSLKLCEHEKENRTYRSECSQSIIGTEKKDGGRDDAAVLVIHLTSVSEMASKGTISMYRQ